MPSYKKKADDTPVPGGPNQPVINTGTPPPTTTTPPPTNSTDNWPPVTDPWLEIARKAATDRLKGVKPPPGQETGNGYDAWIMAWFHAGVDAGDADLMRRAGITTKSEGGGDNDLIAPWDKAAPSSEWLNKRAPTASELRRYYFDTKKSEDLARYPDRVVAKWIKGYWKVKEGYFVNDFGDIVEKPTESGPKSNAAGYPTGLKNPEGSDNNSNNNNSNRNTTTTDTPENPLTNKLLKMWMEDQGIFAGDAPTGQREVATTLPGGALWWGQQAVPPTTTTTPSDTLPTVGLPVQPSTPPPTTPTFFGASAPLGTSPAPTTPTNPTSTTPTNQTLPDFSKFIINKGVGNPLVSALMKAAFPRLPS